MLTSVEFENYRGFERLKVEGLSRVNLITGYNNSGKTSLLEGLHFLASGGELAVLANSCIQRDEVSYSDHPQANGVPNIKHVFFGHELKSGTFLKIHGSNGYPSLTVTFEWDVGFEAGEFGERADLVIEKEGNGPPKTIQIGLRGELWLPERNRSCIDRASKFIRMLSSQSLTSAAMSDAWGRAIIEGRELLVYEALRLIEPDLEDIVFVPHGTANSSVWARMKGSQLRVPLGSFGDGMRRCVALGLALHETTGGILLIDEVDTGLHWSVMSDMWKLVIETAIRTDTQVFATTHSLDCIRALARLCEDNPQYAEHISAQKLHRSLDHSVSLDARNLMIAVEQDIEVR